MSDYTMQGYYNKNLYKRLLVRLSSFSNTQKSILPIGRSVNILPTQNLVSPKVLADLPFFYPVEEHLKINIQPYLNKIIKKNRKLLEELSK